LASEEVDKLLVMSTIFKRLNFSKIPNNIESMHYVVQSHKKKNIVHDLIIVREIGGDIAHYNMENNCLMIKIVLITSHWSTFSEAKWSVVSSTVFMVDRGWSSKTCDIMLSI
jgi:hypothetical protein